jgi:hypothetical protein
MRLNAEDAKLTQSAQKKTKIPLKKLNAMNDF